MFPRYCTFVLNIICPQATSTVMYASLLSAAYQEVKDLDRENPNAVRRIRLHLSLLLGGSSDSNQNVLGSYISQIAKSFTYFPVSTAIQASAYFGAAVLNSAGNQVVVSSLAFSFCRESLLNITTRVSTRLL